MKLPPGARLLFLLALAAALRIAWASRVGPVEFLQIDGREYREIAEHLARGDGYAIASPRWFEPAALLPGGPRPDCYRPPLLPLLGAPLFLLPGHWEIWARALMILLGTAPVPLLWVLGRRIGEPRAGRIGAALMAVHPYAIYYAGYWSTETPFLLLILGTATLLARRGEGRAGARDAICAGLLAGAAALARPTGLVLIPLFAGAMAMDGRLRVSRGSLRLAGLFLAAAALCLAPWTVRNVAVAGVPHPGTFFGPYNRWLGHNDEVLALYRAAGTPAFAARLRGLYEESATVTQDFEHRGIRDLHAMNREWDRRTCVWIAEDPARAAELWMLRAIHYFRAAPERTQVSRRVWLAAALYTWPVHLLALAALMLRRPRAPWILLAPPVAGLVASLPFIFHLRFRHPFLDPYAVFLAGAAVAAVFDRDRSKSCSNLSVESTIRSTE